MRWEQEQVDCLSRRKLEGTEVSRKARRKVHICHFCDRCIKLTESGWPEIDDLQSTQEEADTRVLLHAKHAAIPALICITEDRYVVGA